MSGSVKRYRLDVPLYNMVEDPHGYWIDRDDYEAVVRELAAAREKLESVTVVKDGMIRVAKELSDEVERLRALLDEAQAEHERLRNAIGYALSVGQVVGGSKQLLRAAIAGEGVKG